MEWNDGSNFAQHTEVPKDGAFASLPLPASLLFRKPDATPAAERTPEIWTPLVLAMSGFMAIAAQRIGPALSTPAMVPVWLFLAGLMAIFASYRSARLSLGITTFLAVAAAPLIFSLGIDAPTSRTARALLLVLVLPATAALVHIALTNYMTRTLAASKLKSHDRERLTEFVEKHSRSTPIYTAALVLIPVFWIVGTSPAAVLVTSALLTVVLSGAGILFPDRDCQGNKGDELFCVLRHVNFDWLNAVDDELPEETPVRSKPVRRTAVFIALPLLMLALAPDFALFDVLGERLVEHNDEAASWALFTATASFLFAAPALILAFGFAFVAQPVTTLLAEIYAVGSLPKPKKNPSPEPNKKRKRGKGKSNRPAPVNPSPEPTVTAQCVVETNTERFVAGFAVQRKDNGKQGGQGRKESIDVTPTDPKR